MATAIRSLRTSSSAPRAVAAIQRISISSASATSAPQRSRRSIHTHTHTHTHIYTAQQHPITTTATRITTRTAAAAAAALHTTATHLRPAASRRRHPVTGEPVPDGPPTTDFGRMDIFADTPQPSTAVDACLPDGFALSSGLRIVGGSGVLLVGGEAFAWRPWSNASTSASGPDGSEGKGKGGYRLLNARGQWEVPSPEEAFGLLGLVWPRPDLLILGLGPQLRPLSPETRRYISSLGMRVEVLDTRNAAAQFNLLATERGVDDVAAALVPIGWKEGVRGV